VLFKVRRSADSCHPEIGTDPCGDHILRECLAQSDAGELIRGDIGQTGVDTELDLDVDAIPSE
jgi:hypothetical protein